MRRIRVIHVKDIVHKRPVEVFVLEMDDAKTWKLYGVCSHEMPDAEKAERMFESLWLKHEKDKTLV